MFDTGSSWIWVGLSNCTTCFSDNLYEYDESDTFNVLSDEPVELNYISGSVSGVMFEETICL